VSALMLEEDEPVFIFVELYTYKFHMEVPLNLL
jgi:hypothetical protein